MYYYILLDEVEYKNKLQNLNISVLFITILGLISILVLFRIRDKETKLSQQDKFVQNSLHEIRTPLSIITLNNQLRTKEFGDDEYSEEIDSALKTLQNSYNDMSFILTNKEVAYKEEDIFLSDILESRVNYFSNIAKSNNKIIKLNCDSEYFIIISKIEIIRLIDNNLSNALKYSSKNSTVEVILKDNILSFHNMGKPILNMEKVFNKYTRENNVIGGYGLGLNIVKQISDKYQITILLKSDEKSGTTFKYIFK